MPQQDFYEQTYHTIYQNLLKSEGLLGPDGEQKRAWHCDPLVLHAPGTCDGCDNYPERQQARITKHVNFTGEYLADRSPCPSELFRPAELIHRWGGNRPTKGEGIASLEIIDTNPEGTAIIPIDRDLYINPGLEQSIFIQYVPEMHDYSWDEFKNQGVCLIAVRPKLIRDDATKPV